MGFERFTKDARAVVLAAFQQEAGPLGSDTVEAEHLLLALSAHPSLRHLELDHDQIAAALIREEERSLAGAGVAGGDLARPPLPARSGKPKLATSAKLALQRAASAAQGRGETRIQAHHLLRGVLAAEHGRVPRALRIAGIDVADLRTRL